MPMPQGLHDALWSRRLNSRVLLDHCYFAGVPVAEVFVALASLPGAGATLVFVATYLSCHNSRGLLP